MGRRNALQECVDQSSVFKEVLAQGLGCGAAHNEALVENLDAGGATVHVSDFSDQFGEELLGEVPLKPLECFCGLQLHGNASENLVEQQHGLAFLLGLRIVNRRANRRPEVLLQALV